MRENTLAPGTKVELEIDEGGAWTATSPMYPEWRMEGSDTFNSADTAIRDFEEWVAKGNLGKMSGE